MIDIENLQKSIDFFKKNPQMLEYHSELWKQNPFIQIIRNNNFNFFVDFLNEFKGQINYFDVLLDESSKCNNYLITQHLIKNFFQGKNIPPTSLVWASSNNCEQVIDLLLEQPIDFSYNNYEALTISILEHNDIFKKILPKLTPQDAIDFCKFIDESKDLFREKVKEYLKKELKEKVDMGLLANALEENNSKKRIIL